MKTTATIILLFISIQLSAQIPTWSENISCIVYTHCTPCHNPDGIAPFSLLEYSDAAPLASLLADATDSGYMPRWQPEEGLNSFQGERVLTKNEKLAFQYWASAGAPLGDTAYLQAPPVYGDWQIESPDFTLKLDDYIIQDRGAGNDDFVCINKDMGISAPTFMTAFELIPGGPVHHSLVAISPNKPDTAQFCFSPISKKVIGGWAPGASVFRLPDGMGIPILPGSDLEVNLHFPYQVVGELDSTRINMTFSNDPTLRTVGVIPYLHHGFHIVGDRDAIASSTGAPLIIPANTVKSVWEYRKVDEDITLLSINPHMHLIGSSMTVWAQFPDLSVKVLVHIPQWDPRWQGFYTYKKPIIMPAGTRVIAQSVYDNTTSNPRNPNDPPQVVIQGPNAADEMMMVMMHYTAYQVGDESLVFDHSDHGAHYLDCDPKAPTLAPRIYNQITYTHLEAGQIEVYDLTGRLVYQGAEYDLNRHSLEAQPYIFARFSGRSVEMPLH